MHWFSLRWWRYVLDDSRAEYDSGPWNLWPKCLQAEWMQRLNDWNYVTNPFARARNYLMRCRCRAMGHPDGPVWYNVGAYEPDGRCRRCGEDIW